MISVLADTTRQYAELLQLANPGLELVPWVATWVTSYGEYFANLPAASAPFWMFASVVVASLTAIHISSKK